MARWKHPLVRVDNAAQITLVPSQADVDVRFLQGGQDYNVVDLLDELGSRGWELTAVQGREFWFRQPMPDTSGEVYVY